MVIANRDINIIADMEGTTGVKLNNSRQKLRARFEIVKKLGQGTYGKVQLAINKESGEEVAIKTIKKAKIETDQDLVRIQREIQIMSSVQHPHIIHIYEVFENKEKIVLVMEYANGGELYDYLSYKKVLSELEARRLFRQIASAVYYCHRNRICHRDLKLENILMDDQGNAKIADFGLSNVFSDQNFLTTYCGSPLYASPEIVRGTPYYGPEVDCWSLGVLLYTLVYGAMPFDGSNFKKLVKQISDGDYYEPKKPSDASGLIRRMLDVCAEKRSTIEDICSDWWVNLGYEECLHDVAEDLCRQLPVRLDYLLALAAPPSDQQPCGEGAVPSGEAAAVKPENLDEIVPNGYPEESSEVGDVQQPNEDVEEEEEAQPGAARKHKLTTSVSQARRSTSAMDRKKTKTSEEKDNDVEEVSEEGEPEATGDEKEQESPEREKAVDVEQQETVIVDEAEKQIAEQPEHEQEVLLPSAASDKSAPSTPETPGASGQTKAPFGKGAPARTIKARKGSDAGSGKEEIKMADRRRLTFPTLKVTEQKRNLETKQPEKKSVVIPGFRLSSVRKAFEASSGSPPKPSSRSPPKTVATRIPMKDIGNGSGLKVDISGRAIQAKEAKGKASDTAPTPETTAAAKKSASPPKLNRVASTGTTAKGTTPTSRVGSLGTVCKTELKTPVKVPPTTAPSSSKPLASTKAPAAAAVAPKIKTPPTVGLRKPLYGAKKQEAKISVKPEATLSRGNSVEEGSAAQSPDVTADNSKMPERHELDQVAQDEVKDEPHGTIVLEKQQKLEAEEPPKRKVSCLEIVLDSATEETQKPTLATKEPPTPHRAEVLFKVGKPEVSGQSKPEVGVSLEGLPKPGRKMVSYVTAITGSAPSTPPTPPITGEPEQAQSQPRCDASGNWRFGNAQYENEDVEESEPRGYSVYRSKYRSVHTYRSVVEQHVDAVPERVLERSGSVSSTGSASDLDDVFEEFNSDTILLSLLSRTKTLLESLARRDPIMAVPAASLVARSAGIFSDLRSLGFPGTSIKARLTPSYRRRGSAGSTDESHESGWKMGSGCGSWKTAASSCAEPFSPDSSAGSGSTRKPSSYSRSVSREAEDDLSSSASTCKVSATVRSLRSTYSRSYSSELSELEDNCNSKTSSMGSSSRLSRQEGYSPSCSSRRGETPQQEVGGTRSRESSIGSESGYGSRISGRLPGISGGVRSASRDRTTTIYATLRDRTSSPAGGAASRPRSVMVGDLFGPEDTGASGRGMLYRDAGLTQSSTSPSEDIGIYGTMRGPGRRPPTRYTRSVTKEMAPEERGSTSCMSRPRSVLVLSEPANDCGQPEVATAPRVVRHYSRSVTRSDNGKEKEEEEEEHLEEEAGGRRYTSHTHQVLRQESSNGDSPSTASLGAGGGGGGSDGTATPTDSLETSSVCSDAAGDRDSQSRTDEETVGERIRRKSFFARFNDSRIPRKGRRSSGRDVLLEPDPSGWLPPQSPLRSTHFRAATSLEDDPFAMPAPTQMPHRRTVYCYPSTVELEWSSSHHRPTTIRRVTRDLPEYPSHSAVVDEILHPQRAARAHSVPANDVPDCGEGHSGVEGLEAHCSGQIDGHVPTQSNRCPHATPTVRRHSSMNSPRRPSRLSLVVDDVGDEVGSAGVGGSGYASSPEGASSTRTYVSGPRMRNHAYSSLLMDGMGENHREVIRRAMDLCGSFRY